MRLAVFLVTLLLVAWTAYASSPNFDLGTGLSAKVAAKMKAAEAKWREAVSIPASPTVLKSPQSKCFDESYLREILRRRDYTYHLLDVGTKKLKLADQSRALYAQVVSAAGPKPPVMMKGFDGPYYLLKSRIRLAIGVARANISREMAGNAATSNYCFQAMEAAIDALRDAASDAEKGPDGAARAVRIRKLRTSLFEIWEAAQKSKDTRAIGGLDLTRLWDDSGLSKQPDKK